MHGTPEVSARPVANAGCRIGRQITGIHRTERCVQCHAARIRLAASQRMAALAIAHFGQIRAALCGAAGGWG